MINCLDHLIIAVKNIDKAEDDYMKIFGFPPVWKGAHKELGIINSIFNFHNTYLELLAAKGEGLGARFVNNVLKKNGEGLVGIVLGAEDLNDIANTLKAKGYSVAEPVIGKGENFKDRKIRGWRSLYLPPELTRGLFSFVIQHTEGQLPSPKVFNHSSVNKLDHVVINTNDADGFIDVYRDIYKIRLALDKTIEHWKSRMLFFRLNKTTIEVIEKNHEKDAVDNLWGLAWEVKSLEKACNRLLNAGVDVRPIKNGLKENTIVATVKSHTHNVPTLLIEHI